MNIDLLITREGEAGLITSENLVKKVIGVLVDTETAMLSLEYADMDNLDLNIPVEADFLSVLDENAMLHIGAVKNDNIAQAYQVPVMFSDDPYRSELLGKEEQEYPLLAFHAFMRNCAFGQPVHRDDLADEDSMGCILGDTKPSALQFAPHLERRYALEAKPVAAPRMNAPGMGLGGGGGGGGTYSGGAYQQYRGKDKKDSSDDR